MKIKEIKICCENWDEFTIQGEFVEYFVAEGIHKSIKRQIQNLKAEQCLTV